MKIENLIKKLKNKTDWYDIYIDSGEGASISFKDNRLYSIKESQNNGLGLRVNVKKRTGFSFTNDIDKSGDIAEMAIASSKYGDEEAFTLPGENPGKTFEPLSSEFESFSIDEEIDKGKKAIEEILAKYPDMKINLGIGSASGEKRLINSLGIDQGYRFTYYGASITANYVFEDGVRLNVWEGVTGLKSLDFHDLTFKILKKIDDAVKIQSAKSRKIPLLIPPVALSSLLGIVKSGFSARAVFKGVSPFAGKLGEREFNEKLTLRDNPLIEESPYSYPFDDEGIPGKDKLLIEKGVISTYITDLKYAHKLGIEPSGNSARGYSSLPSSSFSNVTLQPGVRHSRDIISGIKKGILAEQFIGLGQSNTITGDFSANLDLAYLIENGEITGRVKDCMISDNLFNLLKGDIELSSDIEQRGASFVPYLYLPSVNYTEA